MKLFSLNKDKLDPINGIPFKLRMFLSITPLEPDLAGMKASVFT